MRVPTVVATPAHTDGFETLAERFALDAGLSRIARRAASPAGALRRGVAPILKAVGVKGADRSPYDQFMLRGEQLGGATSFMKDGMTLDRTSYQGETIGVELPVTVDLVVRETEPGFAGDTQTGARKPATTETGLVVTVPIFVEEGDTIRVDTRTGEYQTRV